MTTTKYIMRCTDTHSFSSREWDEPIESSTFGKPKNNEEAVDIAEKLIANFNSTLRVGEHRRILLNIRKETLIIEEVWDLEKEVKKMEKSK